MTLPSSLVSDRKGKKKQIQPKHASVVKSHVCKIIQCFHLCCRGNGRWDDSTCGALFTEDRHALMHQQLQELLNMSACVRSYSHRGPWRLSGENICCPSTRLQRRVLGRGAVMRSAAVGYFWIMPVNAVLAERWKYSRAPGEDLAKHVHLPDCDSPDCQKLWQR